MGRYLIEMNSRHRPFVMVLIVLALAGSGIAGATAAGRGETSKVYAVVDIDRIGFERLEALKAAPGLAWWEELDDQLLVCGSRAAVRALSGRYDVRVLDVPVNERGLRFVYRLHGDEAIETNAVVLARGGHVTVVQSDDAWGDTLASLHDDHREHGPYEAHAASAPFVPNMVLAHQVANGRPRPASKQVRTNGFDVPVQQLVDSVDGNRWNADIQTLGGWNRWTRGTQVLTARDWLVEQFQAMPGLTVETQAFPVGSNTGFNVVATLTGTTRPNEWYIVGAHYDSTSQNTSLAAPGCEDNGSGTAGVLEMARIFTAHPPEATIKFICYSGEEQGLFGSTDHASDLVASGDSAKVEAMINMDMIGYTGDADLDCLLETGTIGQFITDACADAAEQYTTLRIVTSLNPFGSDHVPYLNRGIPSLLTIENDWNSYPNYHKTTDTANNITIEMGRQTLRMNVAALANMINGAVVSRGTDTAGIFVPSSSTFFLKNSNASGTADVAFQFGPANAGWIPVAGDWNGDGTDSVGLYDPVASAFFLRNALSPGSADVIVIFGAANSGWRPLAGDWDGNGTDTIGLYNPVTGAFFLKNSNTPGPADIVVIYGPPNSVPIVGDWDSNGTDTLGVFVPSTAAWFLRNSNTPGVASLSFGYGAAGASQTPVAGDWNGDNFTTPCLYQTATGAWFESDVNASGPANNLFVYGPPGAVAVRGDWDGL
jgi:hypothetical protein